MNCDSHGEDVPIRTRESGSQQCRYCYNEYMAEYMSARYYRRRDEWIKKLGGKCVDCGTTEKLEFDHVDRTTKSFDVGKALAGWTHAKLEAEMSKCVLRYEYHHKVKSDEELRVEYGEGLTGKKNCRCVLCKPLKDEYNKRYK